MKMILYSSLKILAFGGWDGGKWKMAEQAKGREDVWTTGGVFIFRQKLEQGPGTDSTFDGLY
jgi:hypothetical protein